MTELWKEGQKVVFSKSLKTSPILPSFVVYPKFLCPFSFKSERAKFSSFSRGRGHPGRSSSSIEVVIKTCKNFSICTYPRINDSVRYIINLRFSLL